MLVSDLFEDYLPLRGGKSVNLYRNPAVGNLFALLARSQDKIMRGLIVGTDVFWWDAYEATHGDIANVYDPDYMDIENVFAYKRHRLALKAEGESAHLYAGQLAEALAAISPLTRLIARNLPITVTMKNFAF